MRSSTIMMGSSGRLGGFGFLRWFPRPRRIIERRGAMHLANIGLRIVPARTVHQRPVVPHDEVAHRPVMRIDELRLSREFRQLVDEVVALRNRPTLDVPRMTGEVERLAARNRM